MCRKIKNEINKLYIYNVIVNFSMVSLIRNIYLQDEGFSLLQIGVLLSVCFLGKVIFEIPTGFIADYYGNKVSLLGALLLQIISLIVMVCFSSFPMMLMSFIMLAIAYAMTTGCYDTILVEIIKEDSNISLAEVSSKNRFLSYASIGIASLMGGFLYQKGAFYVFGIDVALLIIATFIIWSIPYSKKRQELNIKKTTRVIWNHMLKNRVIVYFVLMEMIIDFAMIPIDEFYLNYLIEVFDFSTEITTCIKGIQFLIVSLAAIPLSKYWKKYNAKNIIKIFPILMCICFWGFTILNDGIIAIVLYITALLIFCCFNPVKYACLHKSILSEYRTTIISIKSICTMTVSVVSQPIFGWIGDNYTMQAGARILITMSIIGLIAINLIFRRTEF